MPNYVTNILVIERTARTRNFETELKSLLEAIKTVENVEGTITERVIDFNKIFPMPSDLEGTRSPMEIISDEEYKEQEQRLANGELTEQEKSWGVYRKLSAKVQAQFIKKYGADNWYDWKTENWGTKWNASQTTKIDEVTISFLTAWGTPLEVIRRLSLNFTNFKFSIDYADEDTGYNVGSYTCEAGLYELSELTGGSQEAYEKAFDLNGACLDELDDVEDAQAKVDEDDAYITALIKYGSREKEIVSDSMPLPFLQFALEYLVELEDYEYAKVVQDEINYREN